MDSSYPGKSIPPWRTETPSISHGEPATMEPPQAEEKKKRKRSAHRKIWRHNKRVWNADYADGEEVLKYGEDVATALRLVHDCNKFPSTAASSSEPSTATSAKHETTARVAEASEPWTTTSARHETTPRVAEAAEPWTATSTKQETTPRVAEAAEPSTATFAKQETTPREAEAAETLAATTSTTTEWPFDDAIWELSNQDLLRYIE